MQSANTALKSGIYLFSQFTHEALLFEGLIICLLCASYTAFWVLKKRKLGAIEQAVPAHVVKDYLNELIVDAEQLRNQLFGLLSAAGITVNAGAMRTHGTAPAVAAKLNPSDQPIDPMALEKMAALETKISEQTSTIEKFIAEKARIEKELAEARAAGPSTPGGAGISDAELNTLREKINNLEGKLAEYSVIEDDLANLKRLQQENAQLRAALGSAPSPSPTPTNVAAAIGAASAVMPAQPQVASAVVPPAATKAASEPAVVTGVAAASGGSSIPSVAEPAPSLTPGAAGSEPSFEGLVDQVEKSLEKKPEASTSPAPAGNMAKSDADLVAEFEKMLNS